ncbi:hypothetical protein PT161_05490 [Erysipelothrix rhusiopathiae]|nr:hypothetical protein [Erysipelothrix rhusiopathiae]
MVLTDLIKSSKYDEIFVSEYDPLKLGEQSIVYKLIRNGKEKEFTLIINNVDTHQPHFTKTTDEILIMEGSTFDIKNYFEAIHDVDGKLEITLKEKADKYKPGVYVMTAEAETKNGNKIGTNFTLAVKSKEEYEKIVANVTPKPVEEPADKNEGNQSGAGSTTEKPVIVQETPQAKPEERPQAIPKSERRLYLFSDGYNVQTAPSACTSDLSAAYSNGWGGSCLPYYGDNHEFADPIGMELNIFD